MEDDVLIFHGPNFCAKTAYYNNSTLKHTHQRICIQDVLRENPDLTLRQMINQRIVGELKKGTKLVLDDTFATKAMRESFINIIHKKVDAAVISCLCFHPKHGGEQLRWTKELYIAEEAGKQNHDKLKAIISTQINDWQDICESPTEAEGIHIINVDTALHVQTEYKLEVPALFIQWDGLVHVRGGDNLLMPGAAEAVQLWYDANPCGRVVVIHDGTAYRQVPTAERENVTKHILKEFAKQLVDCPVYLVLITDPTVTDAYLVPPNPGLLAFLQRLHHLNLWARATMYLYHTTSHMQAAARAGVRHIKASRVFSHPKLAASDHATVCPALPKMFRDMKVVRSLERDQAGDGAQIPMYEALAGGTGLAVQRLRGGRALYACARGQDVLHRYQQLYADHATPVTETESGISRLSRVTQASASNTTATEAVPTLDSRRDLPEWMKSRSSKSGSTPSSPKKQKRKVQDSSMESGGSLRIPSAVYVLSEAELLNMAQTILHESDLPLPTEEEILEAQSLENAETSPDPSPPPVRRAETPKTAPALRVHPAARKKQHMDVLDDILSSYSDEPQYHRVLAEETSSSRSSRSSPRPSGAAADSLVLQSTDTETRKPSKPPQSGGDQVAADSLVAESSDSGKVANMRPTHTEPPDSHVVVASLLTSRGEHTRKNKRLSETSVVGDSLVEDTVTTVPDTVDVPRNRNKKQRTLPPSKENPPNQYESLEISSFLDGLI